MKLLVNCDQVFDCLTRGPFPSGSADDDAVQRHLDACHECRRLAEALRPAVALLHEALPAGEAAELPSYGAADVDDDLCERADGALAARIRLMLDRQEVRPRTVLSQEKWLSAVRFLATSVLAMALLTLLAGVFWQSREGVGRRVVIAPVFIGERHQPTAEGLVHLAALNLPKVCLPAVSAKDAPSSASEGAVSAAYGCCTRCHAAGKGGAVLTHRAVAALQQSCFACHEARL